MCHCNLQGMRRKGGGGRGGPERCASHPSLPVPAPILHAVSNLALIGMMWVCVVWQVDDLSFVLDEEEVAKVHFRPLFELQRASRAAMQHAEAA